MALGSITYASVTWTTGDIITEVKLDNMVANDQAYDAHAAQGVLLNNNVGYYQKDSGGTNRAVVNVNASDYLEVGNANLAGVLLKNICTMSAYRSTAQSVASGDTIVLDTELWDDGADFNNATGVYTVPIAGLYLVTANLGYASVTSGKRYGGYIDVGGTIYSSPLGYATGTSQLTVTIAAMIKLTAGQAVTLKASHDHGSALNTLTGRNNASMQITLIADD